MSFDVVKLFSVLGCLCHTANTATFPLPFSLPQPDTTQEIIFEELFSNFPMNIFTNLADDTEILKLNFNSDNDVSFYLYTRVNPETGYKLNVGNSTNVQLSPIKSNKMIKIIIHGWTDSSSVNWLTVFRYNYLTRDDLNVIIVDWSPTSMLNYPTAVHFVHPIGQYVGELVDFLSKEKNISLDNFHILGHSLGAHIAGLAGYFLSGKIGRITGMDPARPGFESPILKDKKERLDSSDANFVDVIHTCAGTAGFIKALGHADYYPNGGTFRQPGCSHLVAQYCSHARSYQFMAESIIYPEEFVAVKCDNWNNFKAGQCANESKSFMGEKVSLESRGHYFLETRQSSPFGQRA